MLLLPAIEALQLLFSWERRPEEPGGVGSSRVKRMWHILHLGSGKGMLSLETLTLLLADGFLLSFPPKDGSLIKCIASVRFVRQA